jgi:hypothetical protein
LHRHPPILDQKAEVKKILDCLCKTKHVCEYSRPAWGQLI